MFNEFTRRSRSSLCLGVVLILVALGPIAAALEVHHALAAADHDGHEHSAADLCQWVQEHTATSTLSALPTLCFIASVTPHEIQTVALIPPDRFRLTVSPRGPPTA